MMTSPIRKQHMSPAAAAKTIRADLKRAFPGCTFSVQSRSFSQGHAVDVTYTDGPPYDAVRAIAEHYGSRGFDGSDDSTYFDAGDHAALTSEGIVAKTYGGFVHVRRDLSEAARAAVGFRPDVPLWDDVQPRPYTYNALDLRDLATVVEQRARAEADDAG